MSVCDECVCGVHVYVCVVVMVENVGCIFGVVWYVCVCLRGRVCACVCACEG